MLKRRHKEPKSTPADRERYRLEGKLLCARKHLRGCVRDAVIRRQVIGLYPKGADKDKARRDFDDARSALLCAVATVDDAEAELRRYVDAHRDEFVTMAHRVEPDREYNSHRCVEDAWWEMYRV